MPIDREKEMASVTVAGEDLDKEVMEFAESKAGVKGLVDAGVTTIPRFFHHPAITSPALISIPTVDLSLPHPRAVELASAAAREWGFFQVTNHGIPLPVISAALSAVQAFHELPIETKAAHHTRDPAESVAFNPNYELYSSKSASWHDTLRVSLAPTPPDAEKIPEACRQELLAWDEHAQGLAKKLLGLLSEGLGAEAGRLEGLLCMEWRAMVCHYYPYCPEPELTVGLPGHSDAVVLTVLVQNEVEGLLVRKGDAEEGGDGGGSEWFLVEPIPGAIVINVGDTLQMISNDEYKSVEHKVIANPHKKPRVSIGIFYGPDQGDESTHFGPLKELVSQEKPARYREFRMSEVLNRFLNTKSGYNTVLDYFKV